MLAQQSNLTSPEGAGNQPSNDPLAERLRGFGLLGILAILVILAGNFLFAPLSALLVLWWVQLSRTPWREIGYVRPRSWIGSVATGIVFGCVFKFVMKAIVMPLLGADPINHAYHYLAGNQAALAGMLFSLIVGAGFGEETVFRGYMFERLARIFGHSAGAKALAVVVSAGVFGIAHYTVQGVAGVEQAAIVGLVYGTIFAVTGRLWMLMCAHAAFDLTALAMIYWGREADVAHAIFR
jgi:membrane protease YdiL (CAAX protease family)